MTVQRSISATMLAALLTSGAPAAPLIGGAAAQEVAPPLRGATADAAGPAGSLRIGRPAQTKPPKKARQSRSPTVVPVRVETRKPVVSPNLVREVQPTLTGLPDPTTPLPLPRRRIRDDDPYGQVGYRFGGLKLYPAIEEDIGYDSNPNRVAPPAKGSFVSRTGGELRVQSDWSNHELSGYLRGGYSLYTDVPGADRPDGEGALRLRLDAQRDTKLDVEGHYRLDTQRPGSPELNAAVSERPLVWAYGASVGAAQTFNRLQLELRGGVDRTEYEDARLTSGTILPQSDRNVTQYGLKLRTATR